jgi:hypothetical protein
VAVAQKELKKVRSAAKRLGDCRARLGDAMLAAQRSGESVQDIADWAGLPKTTAQRILDEAKQRERERLRAE